MKKLFVALLICIFAMSLFACSNSDSIDPEAKKAADAVIKAVKEKLSYEAKLVTAKAKEAIASSIEKKQEYADQAKEYQEKINELKGTIESLQAKFNKFKEILSPAQWLEVYNYFTAQYKKILGG